MKAVVLEAVGGPEQLVLRDVPEPTAADGQVVVDVRAAGINFLEVLVRRGLYPQAPELPWVPGVEVAGEVDGRRVVGLVRQSGGGYAERVPLDEQWLFELPDGASFEEGAAFLMAFLTAWIPLTRQADLRSGSRVLVHAAAGGVGSAAVQAARLLGAEVVATAGAEAKLALPLSLGASQAVTYERLGEIEPVDVVFDPVGGSLFLDSLTLLRPLGVALEIGFAGGLWPQLEPALLVGRNVGVHGFYLGRLMGLQPELVRGAALDLLRLWREGLLRPVVGASFPLGEAGEAHRHVEERRSTGKVVLVP
ncbi:MAG TPA: NADPH:quinone oxidoreductase family protein [Gaiellaceae bacterium]